MKIDNPNNTPAEVLDLKDAAQALKVSVRTVRNLVYRGHLRRLPLGKILIPHTEIQRFLTQGLI